MKENSKRAGNTDVKNPMKENPQSARETNATTYSKISLRVHKRIT